MANSLNQGITTLFFFSAIILGFFVQTKQDTPCAYPCYPPPTGTGGGTQIGGSVPQTPPVSYSPPPPQGTSYPTPTGTLPYYPPPPYGNSLYGQPPPDPILPYFPYYYRKPPHKTVDESSATSNPGKSLLMIATTNFIVFVFLVVSSLGY